jgi:CRP/FNR family transcriptional regulator, cyclic AMP receptor protein
MRKALLFLGVLDDSDISWLVKTGTRKELPPGEFLVHEGRALESIFLVIDGRFSVTLAALGGREVASLLSGEIIGEMSFVDSNPPSASVRAVDPSSVLAIPRSLLAGRLSEDPPFAARFYRAVAIFLADRLRSTVATLGYSSEQKLDPEKLYKDEIDPDTLETISLAGARFDWILRQLRST